MQDEINAALLDRVDGAYAAIQRVERNLIRIHGELQTNHKGLSDQVKEVLTEVKNHGTDLALVQKNIGVLAETAKDHKVGIEQIAADQQTMAQDLHELVLLLKPGSDGQSGPKVND